MNILIKILNIELKKKKQEDWLVKIQDIYQTSFIHDINDKKHASFQGYQKYIFDMTRKIKTRIIKS